MRLDELNALDAGSAERELLRCCGSTRWARQMAAARPFESEDQMGASGDAIWRALEPADWLEAFAAHPRIGAGRAGKAERAGEDEEAEDADWSSGEQSCVASASETVLDRLAESNREYEDRFGYIFIVCATGKGAGEMLAILERRLHNDRTEELKVAAEEQRTITRLRLAKLLA